jgi:DNA-binding NarL/FixJ family response regulator
VDFLTEGALLVDGIDRIAVLLADEQGLFREAVRMVLAAQPDIEVVAEAGDGEAAVEQARLHKPDVALISSVLDGYGGFRGARAISEAVPQCRVLALTPQGDASTLADAFEAGASGHLSKESPVSQLVDAIRTVHRDGILVPPTELPGLIRALVRRRRDRDQIASRYDKLTDRERQVLGLLIEGSDNEAIGRALLISPQTARTHVQNILAKLEVHSRLEAAALVRQVLWNGLIEPPIGVAGGQSLRNGVA